MNGDYWRVDRRLRSGWLPLFASLLWLVAHVELNRAATLLDLETQVEIAAGRSEINALRAMAFQRELERRENRCFPWGGK